MLFVVGCLSCDKSALDERFEIPDGFKGEVKIIYGQKGKPPIPFEKRKLIYRIPKSGILETSTLDPNTGWFSAEYVFVPSGRVIPNYPYTSPPLPPPPDDLVVLYAGLGSGGALTTNIEPPPLVYHFEIVSKYADDLMKREMYKASKQPNP